MTEIRPPSLWTSRIVALRRTDAVMPCQWQLSRRCGDQRKAERLCIKRIYLHDIMMSTLRLTGFLTTHQSNLDLEAGSLDGNKEARLTDKEQRFPAWLLASRDRNISAALQYVCIIQKKWLESKLRNAHSRLLAIRQRIWRSYAQDDVLRGIQSL